MAVLQTATWPLGFMLVARRAGIEPAASGFGDQRSAIGTDGVSMRREGFEPPFAARAGRVTACCIAGSATCAKLSVSVGGFEPPISCTRNTRDAKLHHTLNQ